MKKFTKILPYMVVIVLGAGFFYGMAHGQNPSVGFGQTSSVGSIGLAGGAEAGTSAGSSIMNVIKTFINWILGLLSLIALVVLLRGGFNMVTAAGDETKYKKGFKILQQAAVGLAIIGLSWIIVSAIFWIIGGASSATSTTVGTIQ